MTLPYENATSGGNALNEIQKILQGFGCQRVGTMLDIEQGEQIVQFTYRNRNVTIKASYRGYAAAWLKHHPYTNRMRCTEQEHKRRAVAQAEISVCSLLRDWIKGQITAVEVGMMTFEGAFLGNLLLPSGQTVMEVLVDKDLLRLEA